MQQWSPSSHQARLQLCQSEWNEHWSQPDFIKWQYQNKWGVQLPNGPINKQRIESLIQQSKKTPSRTQNRYRIFSFLVIGKINPNSGLS